MRLKGSKSSLNLEGKPFKSNNNIPRIVRSLFKKKLRDSKLLRKAKSVKRCVAIRRRILRAEIEIKECYQNWKKTREDDIISKSQINKNILFRYIKKLQKQKSKVGPFYKNGELIKEDPANTLVNQYSSVFSKPDMNFCVNNPEVFFTSKCWFCEQERVHICSEDHDSVTKGIPEL